MTRVITETNLTSWVSTSMCQRRVVPSLRSTCHVSMHIHGGEPSQLQSTGKDRVSTLKSHEGKPRHGAEAHSNVLLVHVEYFEARQRGNASPELRLMHRHKAGQPEHPEVCQPL